MYGKLINGELYGAPNPLKTADGDVFTNDPAVYLASGYKPIITAEYPSDGKNYVGSWAETATEINQVWAEMPQSDDDRITDTEALEIITGGAI